MEPISRKARLVIFSLLFVWQCQIPFLEDNKKADQASNAFLGVAALNLVSNTGNCESGGDIWARNTQTNVSYCVPVDLITSRAKFEIYKEKNLFVNIDLNAFANLFEDSIYPKVTAAFGEPSDTDRNGKITILILDIRDGARAGTSFVAGFYDPVNFYSDQPSTGLRSNYKEVLYLDGKELIESLSRDPSAFASTAAHEFQHLIRFPYMAATRAVDDLWINEGTSEVASDIAGFAPQRLRIDCFRGADSQRCPNGANGISMLNWGTTDSATILKQYALAYAYMRYIYDISGSTDTQRNSFFRNTVQGDTSGLRAGFAGTLMRVLRSSPNYNSTLLGNSDHEAFFRTFTVFMGQASGTTSFSTVERFTSSLGIESVNLASVASTYPLGTILADLADPSKQLPATPTSGNISTGSVRVFGTGYTLNNPAPTGSGWNSYGTATRFPNMSVVRNTSNSKSILAWAAYSTTVPSSSQRTLSQIKADQEVKRDRLQSLTDYVDWKTDPVGVCGHQFIESDSMLYTSNETIVK